MEIVEYRAQHYASLITAILKAIGVPLSKVRIVRESSYSMTLPFWKDKMRMCSVALLEDIKAVGLEISMTPIMSTLLCPIYQALSEVYVGSDFQLGGQDQVRALIKKQRKREFFNVSASFG
jgi:tyrosyl-tRNA synthetase